MKEQAWDTMIRDKFIAGQRQCELRRQLDGFAQDTPIGETVDSCRVWESHSDPDRIVTVNCESDVGNQPGDSRTREPVVTVDAGGDSEERATFNASPFKCANNCSAAVSSDQPFDFTMACTM